MLLLVILILAILWLWMAVCVFIYGVKTFLKPYDEEIEDDYLY